MHANDDQVQQLLDKINFKSVEINENQIDLIQKISEYGAPALNMLFEILHERQGKAEIGPIDGLIYETLRCSSDSHIQHLLDKYFTMGIVPLKSEKNIDYDELQQLLAKKDFLQANIVTQAKLCELAEINPKDRQWLYFTDIPTLPATDLQTIDNLWRIYSFNRFGFSIQKQIWTSVKHDWTHLLIKIKWIVNNNLCRYPQEFIWDMTAPKGHLPLFNQLRGTQALTSLLSHKACG